jgi:hypothetical protein
MDLRADQFDAQLPRKMSQDRFDMSSVLASFNAPFRAEELAESASMPLSNTMALQPLPDLSPMMAPGNMYNPGSSLGPNAPFCNQYGLVNNPMSASASFGSLYWPAVMPPAPTDMDYSSVASDRHIKMEDEPLPQPPQFDYENTSFGSPSNSSNMSDSSEDTKPTVFNTDIDTLMRAIQSKHSTEQQTQQPGSPSSQSSSTISTATTTTTSPQRTRSKKQHKCTIPGCDKAFRQKTHLDIHARVHTGIKPFLCKEPNCGQRFSQLGNLKTHQRRHTGERPYHCDICGKTFAQHGNVRAHKVVHTAAKPYTCKLDECGKHFTQLGNLKSHQNKFHIATIRRLRDRFENFTEGDVVEDWERAMWEYFVGLYKHCNQGIKGRGKERRAGNDVFDAMSLSPSSDYVAERRDSLVSSDASVGWS